MSKIDLHIHSSFSLDGELSPEKIVFLGHEKGLQFMSITDHNSVRGVKPAVKAAESFGIRIIPGIEIGV